MRKNTVGPWNPRMRNPGHGAHGYGGSTVPVCAFPHTTSLPVLAEKYPILNRMKNYKIKQKGIESGMVRWGEVIVDGWLEQEMTSEQRIE